jgi:lipopolysaccharide transport system ATP-binding protein
MYVRLAFAVIAHVDADILVVDEALAVGDAYFTQKCMRFINQFKVQGGTLFFVSHDTNAILSLCKKVILLNNGLVSEIGEPKKVSDIYLTALYGLSQKVDGISDYDSGACAEAEIYAECQSIDCKEKNKNDIKKFDEVIVSKFDISGNGFGDGGAKILDIYFKNIFGERLGSFAFEERISLKISCLALRKIDAPIVGFTFRDRLGQSLFVNNTLEIKHHEVKPIFPGQYFFGEFEFVMPILQAGDYAISPAVADGDQQNHVQLHWIHDAIILRVDPTSTVMGLIGLPINKIELGILK